MNKKFAQSLTVASAFLFLHGLPGLCRVQSGAPASLHTPKASSPAQAKRDSPPADDFSGFEYTDEQKAEIDAIRKDTKAQVDAVEKDQKLSPDQKEAMIVGYSRLEYGRMYTVLTPVQRREVQQRLRTRRVADEAAKKKQVPRK
jgi:Spy/CpxP family protein refolding chaperone